MTICEAERKNMSGVAKRLAVLLCMLILAGCSADCFNVIDPHPNASLPCRVAFVAELVVMSPFALVSNSIDELHDAAQEKDEWRRLQANDPEAVAACAIRDCDDGTFLYPSYLATPEKLAELREHSADQVISWWSEHPRPEQMPALMSAYYHKGVKLMQTDPAEAEIFLHKAAALSVNPGTAKGLDSHEFGAATVNHYFYSNLVESIQQNLMVLRYQQDVRSQPTAVHFQCQAIAAYPPVWNADNDGGPAFDSSFGYDDHLRGACMSALNDLFHQFPEPEDGRLVVVPGIFKPVTGR